MSPRPAHCQLLDTGAADLILRLKQTSSAKPLPELPFTQQTDPGYRGYRHTWTVWSSLCCMLQKQGQVSTYIGPAIWTVSHTDSQLLCHYGGCTALAVQHTHCTESGTLRTVLKWLQAAESKIQGTASHADQHPNDCQICIFVLQNCSVYKGQSIFDAPDMHRCTCLCCGFPLMLRV